MTKIINKLAIYLFILTLFVPLLGHLFGHIIGVQNAGINEKRNLSTLPEISSLIRPAEFSDKLSQYLDDNFGLRTYFIRAKRRIEISINGRTNQVVSGTTHPWLFLIGEYAEAQYSGRPYLRNDQIISWNARLKTLKTTLQENNIKFASVKLPGKARLYPEYVPKSFGSYSGVLPDKELNFELALEPVFIQAKSSGAELFYATDTHWNRSGVQLAFDKITEHMGSTTLLKLTPEFQEDSTADFQGDLVSLAGLDHRKYNEPHKGPIKAPS